MEGKTWSFYRSACPLTNPKRPFPFDEPDVFRWVFLWARVYWRAQYPRHPRPESRASGYAVSGLPRANRHRSTLVAGLVTMQLARISFSFSPAGARVVRAISKQAKLTGKDNLEVLLHFQYGLGYAA